MFRFGGRVLAAATRRNAALVSLQQKRTEFFIRTSRIVGVKGSDDSNSVELEAPNPEMGWFQRFNLEATLSAIRWRNPEFDTEEFLKGCQQAFQVLFEMSFSKEESLISSRFSESLISSVRHAVFQTDDNIPAEKYSLSHLDLKTIQIGFVQFAVEPEEPPKIAIDVQFRYNISIVEIKTGKTVDLPPFEETKLDRIEVIEDEEEAKNNNNNNNDKNKKGEEEKKKEEGDMERMVRVTKDDGESVMMDLGDRKVGMRFESYLDRLHWRVTTLWI